MKERKPSGYMKGDRKVTKANRDMYRTSEPAGSRKGVTKPTGHISGERADNKMERSLMKRMSASQASLPGPRKA